MPHALLALENHLEQLHNQVGTALVGGILLLRGLLVLLWLARVAAGWAGGGRPLLPCRLLRRLLLVMRLLIRRLLMGLLITAPVFAAWLL